MTCTPAVRAWRTSWMLCTGGGLRRANRHSRSRRRSSDRRDWSPVAVVTTSSSRAAARLSVALPIASPSTGTVTDTRAGSYPMRDARSASCRQGRRG